MAVGRRRTPRSAAAAVVVLALGASACGVQERKHQADRIINAPKTLAAMRSATLTLDQHIRVKKRPKNFGAVSGAVAAAAPGAAGAADTGGAAPVGPAAAASGRSGVQATLPQGIASEVAPAASPPGAAIAQLALRADFVHDRLEVASKAARSGDLPIQFFDDVRFYQRRISTGGVAIEGRPWVELDFATLKAKNVLRSEQSSSRVTPELLIINPLLMFDLLKGALSGSVRNLGTEQIDGAATTHYRVNLDRDKATRHDANDRRNAIDAMFAASLVTQKIFPAEVWIDTKGAVRRLRVNVDLKPGLRDLIYQETVTMGVKNIAGRPPMAPPNAADVIRVEGLGELRQASQVNG